MQHLEKGDSLPSLRQLGSELGVTHAAVYRHYKNKDDLTGYLLREAYKELYEGFATASAASEDPKLKVLNLCKFFFNHFKKRRGLLKLMFGKEFEDLNQKFMLREVADPIFNLLKQILDDLFNDHPKTAQFSLSLWALTYGFSQLYFLNRLPRHVTSDEQALATLLDTIDLHLKNFSRETNRT